MQNTANLGLPFIEPNQAQKHVTHNEALRILDALVQIGVVGRSAGSPPASPAEGERHIVAAAASGLWAGHPLELAVYVEGVWVFHPPQDGWLAWVEDEARLVVWTGASWTPVVPAVTGAPLFGINAAADTTNRLTVKSDAVLISHDDVTPGTGDARVVVNKGAPGNTASMLFQSNWSGRAEFGCTGDDNWHVKVSADGGTWHEALVVAAASGNVGIGTAAPSTALDVAGPVRMGNFAVAALPDPVAAGAGAMLFVTDELGGAVPAFSDGAAWRRVTDRAVVSV
ncbi:hypothetical protein U879_00355 [Defluviimonas sp. 20V17]|uniref:Uncharacterized protein n=1 Tax=Allgaiera indica TaxID=765699 RepID=A0AAN5A0V4_9RHOB|nr:DUF2793 domain-containing protein [Allgaiera indica]KDB05677.1 hypothetical protein U879_00355 [Defluviimonas sp. 20V17]GHE04278.1 hypothetical protein GCM10008024_30890 [Allgaiera indica]SDX39118.1 Protein of unknown function [Allgaiera indica]